MKTPLGASHLPPYFNSDEVAVVIAPHCEQAKQGRPTEPEPKPLAAPQPGTNEVAADATAAVAGDAVAGDAAAAAAASNLCAGSHRRRGGLSPPPRRCRPSPMHLSPTPILAMAAVKWPAAVATKSAAAKGTRAAKGASASVDV